MAAEAQPAKLHKVDGYHRGAKDEHAAVLTPAKLRKIGGTRAGAKIHRRFRGSAHFGPPCRNPAALELWATP